jgi:hypothetical protein
MSRIVWNCPDRIRESATVIDVEGKGVFRSQLVLHPCGRGRLHSVGRGGGEDNALDVFRRKFSLLQAYPRCGNGQVRRAFRLTCMTPGLHPGFFCDQLASLG